MKYLFNGKEINKQELAVILGVKEMWEQIHIADGLFKNGCFEYEYYLGVNCFTFIPE